MDLNVVSMHCKDSSDDQWLLKHLSFVKLGPFPEAGILLLQLVCFDAMFRHGQGKPTVDIVDCEGGPEVAEGAGKDAPGLYTDEGDSW